MIWIALTNTGNPSPASFGNFTGASLHIIIFYLPGDKIALVLSLRSQDDRENLQLVLNIS